MSSFTLHPPYKLRTNTKNLILILASLFLLIAANAKAVANAPRPTICYFNMVDFITYSSFNSNQLLGASFSLPTAPGISYTGVAVNYPTGTAISALSPTVTGNLSGNGSYAVIPLSLGSGFNFPLGIALDAFGNVYVADYNNNAIKEIAAGTGVISTLGSGFSHPEGIAVDASGNVYVADNGNNAVKVIAAGNGGVSTLGSGFNAPTGVAVDDAGNVYVADYGNNAIKLIAAGNGAVTTLGAGFSNPFGVAVDGSGNVYVADYGHDAVKVIAAGNDAITTLGAGFNHPSCLTLDAAGNLYVTDSYNNAVKKIAAGSGTTTTLSDGFNGPHGVAVDAIGNLYIADSYNNAVKKIIANIYSVSPALPPGLTMDALTGVISGTPTVATAATTYTVTTQNAAGPAIATLSFSTGVPPSIAYTGVAPSYPTGIAIGALSPTVIGTLTGNGSYSEAPITVGTGFSQPQGISLDAAGNVYVADASNNSIRKIAASGGTITTIGSGFLFPEGVAVDTYGNLYVADSYNDAVKKISVSDGAVTTLGAFSTPRDVAVDGAGNVFVADAGNSRIRKIAADGTTTTIGSGFLFPAGVAVDAAGNVYVADIGHAAVKKIAANGGAITTLCSGFSDRYVAVDGAGNVYVADISNNAVKKIDAGTGVITTLGSGFMDPVGIDIDGAGNVYVADGLNDVIIEITAGIYSISPALPAGLTMDPVTGIISGIPTAATPTTTYTVTTQNAAGMAMATLTFSTSAPLPVNWITVNGQLNNTGNAVLNWQVAEQSMASFDIQKSDNGSTFSTIGTVASKGNGTNSYSFTDRGVFNGSSVYRIAEIDQEGKISYSPVIALTGNKQAAINVYPNPAKSSINIVIPGSLLNTNVSVFNMNGSLVKRVHLSSLSNQVSVQGLASGMYMLRFKDGSSRQIIKE